MRYPNHTGKWIVFNFAGADENLSARKYRYIDVKVSPKRSRYHRPGNHQELGQRKMVLHADRP